jgi:hypothetical protein
MGGSRSFKRYAPYGRTVLQRSATDSECRNVVQSWVHFLRTLFVAGPLGSRRSLDGWLLTYNQPITRLNNPS